MRRFSADPSTTVSPWRRCDRLLHRQTIKLSIGLGARPSDGRSFGPIENPELNSGRIRDSPHQPIERVDLPHQLALPEAPDRGIARHGPDGGMRLRDERRSRAKPRRSRSRLAARMASANDDDIVAPRLHAALLFHVKHNLFADAKLPKNHVENIFHVDSPGNLPKSPPGKANIIRY